MEVPGDFPVRRPHRGHRRDELALCGRHVGRRLCGQMNPIIDPNTRSLVKPPSGQTNFRSHVSQTPSVNTTNRVALNSRSVPVNRTESGGFRLMT
ncbi:unnamed protein product [Pleuronectes platessa]|uniref:Uncharacterized protein n=1 Tax=Pleuronectes platessa TaxID=8262 RepID=A0A9N7YJU0_PLEPL|nr:unnamed protein product [Pleuronectes platessa]